MWIRFIAVILLSAVALTSAADPIRFAGSLRLRAENWSWFETPGFEDDYTFLGVLARASVAQQVNPEFDWQVELAAPLLLGLPENGVAPAPRGQLGLGASYRAGSGNDEHAGSLFPKQVFARYRNGSHMIRAGRFEFSEGQEVTPKNPALAAIKSSRVAHRLIGNFAFTHVGRSADGVQYAYDTPALNFTGVVFRPTVGAFDVAGGDQLSGIEIVYGALTYSRANADERIFVIGYRDTRGVLKTDNRPAALRTLDRDDLRITTIGGHYLVASGGADLLLWGAFQTGEWGTQDHRAAAVDLEAGYRFAATMSPSLRIGYFRSSGDDDPSDGTHQTFFQVLPTPRLHARFPFYNAMNSTDAFIQSSLKPTSKTTLTAAVHLLSLTERADLWYAGGGAFEDETFGFAGRPSGGASDLAKVVDVNVDYAFSPRTSFTLYGGFAKGGDVVRSLFNDDAARFVYLEMTRRF